jgi:hypothetical protein
MRKTANVRSRRFDPDSRDIHLDRASMPVQTVFEHHQMVFCVLFTFYNVQLATLSDRQKSFQDVR